jgi:hypothetical protein
LRTIQCKIKQKYGVIFKQFSEGGMKNFAFQNRVLTEGPRTREARTGEGILYLMLQCVLDIGSITMAERSNFHRPRAEIIMIKNLALACSEVTFTFKFCLQSKLVVNIIVIFSRQVLLLVFPVHSNF